TRQTVGQAQVVAEIEKLGGSFELDAKSPDRPVLKVRLDGPHVTDQALKHLVGLERLHTLDLFDTRVTDAGLKHLEGLKNIKWLDLESPHVTDAGLERLRGLTNL